jgi:hypothetical protein
LNEENEKGMRNPREMKFGYRIATAVCIVPASQETDTETVQRKLKRTRNETAGGRGETKTPPTNYNLGYTTGTTQAVSKPKLIPIAQAFSL